MEIGHTSRKGIAGIIAALIIFGLLFVVGDGYFLYVSESNLAYDHAGAARLDALQQQHSESLAVNVALQGSTTLVVSLSNNGGVASTINDTYLTLNSPSSPMLSPPKMIGRAQPLNGSLISHSNITAA